MPRHSLVDDARKFALGWRVWFWLIMAVNFFIPIVFVTRIEAQLTLASYAFASVTIVVLHRRLGWVRLLGVGHLPWLALVPWLVHRYTSTGPSGAFALWMASTIAINATSLVIDAGDITRYLLGERRPIVS